jgi:hypothetical protein
MTVRASCALLALAIAAVAAAAAATNTPTTDSSSPSSSGSKPHIFLVLVDDYGYNNVGYHAKSQANADEIITPNSVLLAWPLRTSHGGGGCSLGGGGVSRFPVRKALHSSAPAPTASFPSPRTRLCVRAQWTRWRRRGSFLSGIMRFVSVLRHGRVSIRAATPFTSTWATTPCVLGARGPPAYALVESRAGAPFIASLSLHAADALQQVGPHFWRERNSAEYDHNSPETQRRGLPHDASGQGMCRTRGCARSCRCCRRRSPPPPLSPRRCRRRRRRRHARLAPLSLRSGTAGSPRLTTCPRAAASPTRCRTSTAPTSACAAAAALDALRL